MVWTGYRDQFPKLAARGWGEGGHFQFQILPPVGRITVPPGGGALAPWGGQHLCPWRHPVRKTDPDLQFSFAGFDKNGDI